MCYLRSQDSHTQNDETKEVEWVWRSRKGIAGDHSLKRKESVTFPPLRGGRLEGTRVSLANFSLPWVHSIAQDTSSSIQMVLSAEQTLMSISEEHSWVLGTTH